MLVFTLGLLLIVVLGFMVEALSVAYTPTPLAAGTKLIIEATRQVSPGINFMPRSEYKVVLVTAAAAASPANVLTEYEALFGDIVAGQKIFFRCTPQDSNGARGVPFVSTVIVA